MKSGSSPLTRGKLGQRISHTGLLWLIPAHAGKTRQVLASSKCDPAHPRSRGENAIFDSARSHCPGSSPLTRGKPGSLMTVHMTVRLIPAHAGKTLMLRSTVLSTTAHPRSRGENKVLAVRLRFLGGSSPLTRGKQAIRLYHVSPQRLIPAHAGKTFAASANTERTAAHPRSRGENAAERPWCDVVGGSSPLTRGKRPPYPVNRLPTGLIPAHAGKTMPITFQYGLVTAHPRSRGENTS